MMNQLLESLGISPRHSRLWVLLLAVFLAGTVMALEWFQNLEHSLELFYVLPVVVAASVLNRWQTVLAALACACVRSAFVTDVPRISFWLDFLMAFVAYSAAGVLVNEMSQNRKRILRAYTRLKMEEDLRRQAQDQVRILVESSPAAIVTLNQKVEVLAANRAAHEMLGYSKPGSLIGCCVADNIPVFAGALRVSHSGGHLHVSSTSWAKRANGSHFPVAVWFSTYEEAGQQRLAGILVDTSEEVREREHETFRNMIDSNRLLAGAVAHEIRNLCSAIRVATSNLGGRPAMTVDADFCALNTLVESLMQIAAFDLTKDKDPVAARVDVTTVLEKLRVVIEQDWADAGGVIRWETDGVMPYVHADEHALLRVFLNLSQNSLRAVQRNGKKQLRIGVTPASGLAMITFEDTGPGVDDPAMLFKPFRDNADGSGIGLYVSRALVRGFGGELTHVPTASGCRFDISLRTYLMERRDS
jgi:PAS domain S-box-containing protein